MSSRYRKRGSAGIKSGEVEQVPKRQKATTATTIPSNFVKTPFHLRQPVRGTSVIRTALSSPESLISRPATNWKKSHLGELMTVLTTTHSLEADDAEMASVVSKYGEWAMGRKEIYDAMDPCYVFLNWGQVQPHPLQAFNLNETLQGDNAPMIVANFPECYSVPTEFLGHMLVGAITNQYAGVRAFIWNLPNPIVSHIHA